MTRAECEKNVLDLMEEAFLVFNSRFPNGSHLSLFATKDGSCAMGFSDHKEILFDSYKSPEGTYKLSN